jgi:adenosylcobinamide-phosphate synthase
MFWFSVVGTLLLLYLVALRCCLLIGPGAVFLLNSAVIYQSIAAKDLHAHAEAVLKPLERNDLKEARNKLSRIVGRDTDLLDECGITRGVVESVAESLTDGMIAPLFWATIGGAPGALVYRAANTLDSIVGHRTEAYESFGKASARIDDVLTWVPARLCATLFCFCKRENFLGTIRAEAADHASPNAGWTESAMAHVLGVRLGGDNFYDGKLVRGPIFHPAGRLPQVADIRRSLRWMWTVAGVGAGFLLAVSFCLNKLQSK